MGDSRIRRKCLVDILIFSHLHPHTRSHPGSPLYTTDSRTYLQRHHDDLSLFFVSTTFSFPFLFALAYEAKRQQKVHDVMMGLDECACFSVQIP
jgi:hypothetical protein